MIGLTLKLFSGLVISPVVPNGASYVLFLDFVLDIKLSMKKKIESKKYSNQCNKSNHNSNNYNIYHLPFEMVHHYYQQLPSANIKVVYKITMPEKRSIRFGGLFLVLWESTGIKYDINN